MRNAAWLAEAECSVAARRGGMHNGTQPKYRGVLRDMRSSTLLSTEMVLAAGALGLCKRAWVESMTGA